MHRLQIDNTIIKDKIPCIKIIVITYGGTARETKIKMLSYEDKFSVYRSLLNDFILPIDYSNIPKMIFIDDGKTSKHTLIIGAESAELLLHDYIKMLSMKYCK